MRIAVIGPGYGTRSPGSPRVGRRARRRLHPPVPWRARRHKARRCRAHLIRSGLIGAGSGLIGAGVRGTWSARALGVPGRRISISGGEGQVGCGVDGWRPDTGCPLLMRMSAASHPTPLRDEWH
jgi:hypothetical protein